MPKTITIDVTEKDLFDFRIKKANKQPMNICKECPIATALHRISGFEKYRVTCISIFGSDLRADLPEDVAKKIRQIDRQMIVSPFSFTIEMKEK